MAPLTIWALVEVAAAVAASGERAPQVERLLLWVLDTGVPSGRALVVEASVKSSFPVNRAAVMTEFPPHYASLSTERASARPAAGRPYSLAVTRARATR